MWPRIVLWIAGMLAIPVAKYVWEKVLEAPSYWKDVEEANAKRTKQEQANKEELERLRKQLSEAGRRAHAKYFPKPVDRSILFRKF